MQLEQLLKHSWPEIEKDAQLRLYLEQAYANEKHTNACCIEVLEAFFKNHKNKLTQKKMINPTPLTERFQLKKGMVLYLTARHIHVTNANLTDELAEELIAENPNRINSFVKHLYGDTSVGEKKKEEGKKEENKKPASKKKSK